MEMEKIVELYEKFDEFCKEYGNDATMPVNRDSIGDFIEWFKYYQKAESKNEKS